MEILRRCGNGKGLPRSIRAIRMVGVCAGALVSASAAAVGRSSKSGGSARCRSARAGLPEVAGRVHRRARQQRAYKVESASRVAGASRDEWGPGVASSGLPPCNSYKWRARADGHV